MSEYNNFVNNVDVNRINEDEVKQFIVENIKETVRRKNGGILPPDMKIPKHTVRNYTKRAMVIISSKREGSDVHI
jgi:hypothetical protein